MKMLSIFVDGAVSGTRHAGAAAIARTQKGYFVGWMSRQFPTMTNNEAEYQAVLLGLKLAKRLGADRVEIISDSEVVVRQMRGDSRVLSPRLKRPHQVSYIFLWNFRIQESDLQPEIIHTIL